MENWRITLSPKWRRFTFPVSSSSSSRNRGNELQRKKGNAAQKVSSSTQEKCRPFGLPQFLNQSGLPQRAAGVRIKTYHQQSNRGGTVGVRVLAGNQLPSHAYQEERRGLRQRRRIPINTKEINFRKGQEKKERRKEWKERQEKKERKKQRVREQEKRSRTMMSHEVNHEDLQG
jgi:hypothetical protein